MSTTPQHSRLAPSSASRWSTCTASIGFIEENKHLLPEQDWTLADEGTRAHEAAAKLLTDPSAVVKTDNAEMRKHVDAYVKHCKSVEEPGDWALTETRIPLFYLPSERGTTDRSLYNPKRIRITDLKYGVGVSVDARENVQLGIYGESQIQKLETIEDIPDDTLVILEIFQPRDRNNPEPVRMWVINRGKLREFMKPVAKAAETILSGGPTKFVSGPHCDKSFCPARGICKQYATQGLIALDDTEAPVDLVLETKLIPPVVTTITRAQRQRILAAKPDLIKWLEVIENQEVAELMAGADPQQFKLVEGKSNRAWKDEDRAAKLLLGHLKHAEIYPPKPPDIISPAQAEALLKAGGVKLKTFFSDAEQAIMAELKTKQPELTDEQLADAAKIITKPPGKPTLVPVADKRLALTFNPTSGLTVLPDETASDAI